MHSPSSSNGGSAPRRHLKRLSLSVAPRSASEMLYSATSGSDRSAVGSPMTPEKHLHSAQYTSTSSPGASEVGVSPGLNRSLGGSSNSAGSRRQRPMSLYGAGSPLTGSNNNIKSAFDGSSPSPLGRTSLRTLQEGSTDSDTPPASGDAEESFSPSSSLSRSTGRRSILGRSAHARGQSSISYARSNGSDSAPTTPRSILPAVRDAPIPSTSTSGAASESVESPGKRAAPASAAPHAEYFPLNTRAAESAAMVANGSNISINEMNVGIGAKSADLLTFIAKKERKCLDLREELKRHEEELANLKRKWEAVIQREMQAAQAPAAVSPGAASSTSPSTSLSSPPASQPLPSPGGLFSSLASSLSASNASPASASPSPKPGNRRLLTTRHSISVASPSRSPNTASNGYFGGSELTQEESPTSSTSSSVEATQEAAAAYDVSKMAKSWLGGMMKSANAVLEGLAPPPSADLGTVAEEEEPEEDEYSDNRTSAAHPQNEKQQQHGRRASEATTGTETSSSSVSSGSPSSSYDEEGRFSTSTSRSSSVSSINSKEEEERFSRNNSSELSLDTVGSGKGEREDITPLATPVLASQATPRGGDHSGDAEDLWGLGGFEDTSARENRERMEQDRIGSRNNSPRMDKAASPNPSTSAAAKAGHGRRRSTAFELGGAWGSMVGKKWNEVANSEMLKKSTRATLNLVDTFEKTLTDAMTVDASADGSRSLQDDTTTSMMLVNGEYVPTLDWSIPSPVQQAPAQQRERALPSGIGGAASWSALLSGRSKNTPKQRAEEWQSNGESSTSPPTGSTRASHSLMDNGPEEQDNLASFNAAIQPQQQSSNTAQARLQASRAKHSKRMSLPSNLLVGEKKSSGSLGLGLESLDEDEKAEAEDGWGW